MGSFFSVKRIYVVAGEMSGDAHAAGLLRELTGLVEGLEIRGAGGPEMKALSGGGTKDFFGQTIAGEVLDIDGVTGGFNFQAAWTTGWIAGRAMAAGAEAGPAGEAAPA